MQLTKVSGLPLELKAVSAAGEIEGYGAIFGNVDSYGEMIVPGAFSASLAQLAKKGAAKVKLLWQHDRTMPIGVWDEMSEDAKGLKVKGRLLIDAVAQAREAHALLLEGALDGLSIGYIAEKVQQHPEREGVLQLTKIALKEVSIVTFAANDRARVEAVKHILAAGGKPTVREFEESLGELGFPKALRAAIASKAAPLLRGDPAPAVSEADFLERLKSGLANLGK